MELGLACTHGVDAPVALTLLVCLTLVCVEHLNQANRRSIRWRIYALFSDDSSDDYVALFAARGFFRAVHA